MSTSEQTDIKQVAENLGKFAELIFTLNNQDCEAKLQTNSKGEAYFDVKARGKDPTEVTDQIKLMTDKLLEYCKNKNIPIAGLKS